MLKWFNRQEETARIEKGLDKTKQSIFGTLHKFFLGKRKVDDAFLDDLEDILITGDVGVKTTLEIIDRLRDKVAKEAFTSEDELVGQLHSTVVEILKSGMNGVESFDHFMDKNEGKKPYVLLVVGVNGVGKTTTIGKLAHLFNSLGKKVVLGAADTFRAAASEQLGIWAQRAGVRIVIHQDGADPASVAFDTVQSAIARKEDIVIIDTAGRLHNKLHLMEELNKIQRSVEKVLPGAPHDVFLVLDASTGQNALVQAREFAKVVTISGLVLTKLDGTAKGGIVLGICNEMKTPVRFIGIGEKIDDLRPFDPDIFVDALFEGVGKS
ncbi:MAG: signal recognition particle-docking protein FtsY [Bacteroidetes bacterium]|nr:signal recognition particle-docking protein FtsY [Bacteroidota bacterium]